MSNAAGCVMSSAGWRSCGSVRTSTGPAVSPTGCGRGGEGGGGAGVRGVRGSLSVGVGCVRMTERHLHDDPPSARQVQAATADIDAAIAAADAAVGFAAARTLVGLAGSVTTVAA